MRTRIGGGATSAYLGIPSVFSERRRWATAARLSADVIAGNKVYKVDDPGGLAFAVMSSSMFITWQKTVGGRWKSDPNFSNTLVWNTLPLPRLAPATRLAAIDAGLKVIAARELHPDRSLEDMYNPLGMDPTLVSAHNALDRVIDKAFGSRRALHTEADRQRVLFQRYEDLTGVDQRQR